MKITSGDNNLIKGILSTDDRLRNKTLAILYQNCFAMVRNFVLKNSGNHQDAEDVFQDGVCILYNNLLDGKFEDEASLPTYLYSICKNIWFMKLRKRKNFQLNDLSELEVASIEDSYVNIQKIEKLINKLNPDCQKILTEFYLNGMKMYDLKTLFNLGSAQAAKNKKLRCMKHLIALIDENRLQIEDFID